MNELQHDLFSQLPPNPTKSTTLAVVRELKQRGEDHEWYPTTEEQIQIVARDVLSLKEHYEFTSSYGDDVRLLDIGAGDGRVLQGLKSTIESEDFQVELLAVEKASLHTQGYRQKQITLLGTDFHEINFISKSTHIAFVNPPYSQFSFWLSTLINQLNFSVLYAIVPERWQDDPAIKASIERRGIKNADVLASSDFFNADRQARAKVQIVRFSFNDFEADAERVERIKRSERPRHYQPILGQNGTCPFQLFIEQELGLKQSYSKTTEKFNEYEEKERIREQMATEGSACYELIRSKGVLSALLDNYEQDVTETLKQYQKIGELNPVLLQELGVDYDALRKGVKAKLFGFRNVYWSLLLEHMKALSERLTAKHKQVLLNTLAANQLDFTYTNAVYIIGYGVELANELIEQSLIDVFESLTSEDAIQRHYVSNQHMYKDEWRHNHGDPNRHAKYVLDYRFISSHYSNFSSYSWEHGLKEDAREFTNDIVVALKLLGYDQFTYSMDYQHISAGDKLVIRGEDANGKETELLSIRYYGNGNRHMRFNQRAMLRLNVTISRLLGWVRNKAEFTAETECSTTVSETDWHLSDGLKVLPQNVLALVNKQAA